MAEKTQNCSYCHSTKLSTQSTQTILHTARILDHAQWAWLLIGHTPLCGVQEWQQLLSVSDPTVWCYTVYMHMYMPVIN